MSSEQVQILKEVLNEAEIQSSFPTIYKAFKNNDVQMHDFYAKSTNIVYTLSGGQSAFQMAISDRTTDIDYLKSYLQMYIPSESLTGIYYFSMLYGTFSYGENIYGDEATPYGIDDYSYIYEFELDKRYFGDFITTPINFIINNSINQDNSNSSLVTPSDERWYKIVFDTYRQFGILDLYTGILYLFSLDPLTIIYYTLTYESNQLRKELNINCSIKSDEFTFSTNPTAFQTETKYLNKMSSSPNLLTNGGLELGTTASWSADYCSLTSSTLTGYVYSGTYSLKATFNDSSSGVDSIIYYEQDLKQNNIQVLDNIRAEWFFKKGNITGNADFIFEIQQYDGASFSTTQSKTVSISSVPQNDWYRVVIYDQLQYVDRIRLRIRVSDNLMDSTSFYVDNTSLKIQRDSTDKSMLYITTIGLYNDTNDLLMVAKLSKPLKKSSYPLSIRIRADLV